MKKEIKEIRNQINTIREQLEKLIDTEENNQNYIYAEEMLTKALNGLHK